MTPLYHSAQPSPIPNASGIYRIIHIVTGRMYIGSAINLHHRQRDHFSALRRGGHPNAKLQHAFNKYGESAFIFEVIELVLIPELLTAREQYWFEREKPFGRKGFNLVPTAGSNLGMKVSLETREKLRISHLGQPGYWAGKKHSPETREKLRISHLGQIAYNRGQTASPETREKLRLANLGKKYSEEARHNMGESHRGKTRSPEAVEKSRLARTGQKRSAESRAKMIASHEQERKTLIVTSPDGIEYSVVGIRQFCKEHSLDRSTLMRVAKGKQHDHKGWKARYPETDAS